MPLNKVMIIGNLGRDPEVKYTADGKTIAKFSVAVSEKRKDKEHTEWFNVVAFDKTAEICGEYLSKGREVFIEGKLHTDEYEKDGEKKRWVELVAFNVVLLSSKGKQDTPAQGLGGVPVTFP